MNYSIVPPEELIEEEELEATEEIEVEGVKLEVRFDAEQRGEIIKVISTDPQDYLDYQPGTTVEFGPELT